jgi:hypothetical protein
MHIIQITPANVTPANLAKLLQFPRSSWDRQFRRLASIMERQGKKKYYREQYIAVGAWPIPAE